MVYVTAMTDAPRVWVLQGATDADPVQGQELARRLGLPFETKNLAYRASYRLPNVAKGAKIMSIDRRKSSLLQAPWPDLVINASPLNVPAARWIASRPGSKAKIVQIGQPRAPLAWFDLVIATPQDGLPRDKNVIEMPMTFAPPAKIDETELVKWHRQFARYPKPWTGVLLGGPSKPYRFDAAAAHELARAVNDLPGGTAIVVASARTPAGVAAILEKDLHAPHLVFPWNPKGSGPEQAVVSLADRFVVTSDSLPLIAAALDTHNPVKVFELPRSRWGIAWDAKRGLAALLARKGFLSPPRDNRRIGPDAAHRDDTAVIQRVRDLIKRA